jgi:hypothetical protein
MIKKLDLGSAKCKNKKCQEVAHYYGLCLEHYLAALDEFEEKSKKVRLVVGKKWR